MLSGLEPKMSISSFTKPESSTLSSEFSVPLTLYLPTQDEPILTMQSSSDIEALHKQLFDAGIKIRREVVGDAYVDKALAGASSNFAKPMQDLVTEMCWGHVWNRPGLDRKQRSLLNIGMLSALNRGPELGIHIRGAINNGLTILEIREAVLQVSVYCGMPAGMEGFKIAERVLSEMIETGELVESKPEKNAS